MNGCAPTSRPARPARPDGDRCRDRVEVASYGFDPTLCGMGSDPYGSLNGPRLRVPSLATTAQASRYLFQLATYPLPGKGKRVWLTGLRQWLEIGLDTNAGVAPVFPVTKLVGRSGSGNPFWRFADGSVSWHVRLVRNGADIPWSNQNVLTTDSFVWRWCESPALVFETATFAAANLDGRGHPDNYLTLTSYTAPNGGLPSGEPVSDLGNFSDIRFPVDDPAKQALDPVRVEGEGFLVFYASVWQTAAATRAVLTVPAMFPIDPQMPEDGFVKDFTPGAGVSQANTPIYWGVGGAMTVER